MKKIDVEILGTGKALPGNKVTNEDLAQIVDTSDEWIQQRTGIRERRISLEENTSDLAARAASQAISRSGIKSEDIDLIIVSTMTPDSNMPSTACLVQNKIHADNAFCMDISAACSGFVYALSTAEKFVRSGQYNYALIVASEVNSKYIDWADRTTCVLFGDGAGAVVLEGNTEGRESFIDEELHSFGSENEALTSGFVDVPNKLSEKKVITTTPLKMDGRAVFNFTITEVPKSIKQLLERAKIQPEVVIAHQANVRIINLIAKRTDIEEKLFFNNLQFYGNTSSASVAIALDEYITGRNTNNSQTILLTAFGGGLTLGNILIRK